MKQPADYLQVNLLPADEQKKRLSRIYALMDQAGIDAAVIRDNANIYYLTGRIFRGYIFLQRNCEPICFVRRPSVLVGNAVHNIRKPENMPAILAEAGIEVSPATAFELDSLPYGEAMRLASIFGAEKPAANISPVMRKARAVKTPFEIDLIRRSGIKQTLVYERIPRLFKEGMSDIELQIEIERASRLEGCLGCFRISGTEMELFMGNVLTGENADNPSPYDFAMGGAGLDPSLPVGANGTIIKNGMPVMVDVNGNYTGYMTDMTRIFYTGRLLDQARKACELSIEICRELAAMMRPGQKASLLYERALEMARQAGMADYFMGHRSHAGFVGHGLGIDINELPVLAPRSNDILEVGNVIAVEPKFVIPGIGAAGIENTYVITENGTELLTGATENPVQLD